MKVLSLKTCNTDLYDFGMRQLIRRLPGAHFTVVGGAAITKCVPRRDNFSTFELNPKQNLLKRLVELFRLAHLTKFDVIFYSYDDEAGYQQIIFDVFVMLLPWKKLVIAHRLELREYYSHPMFYLRTLVKVVAICFRFILRIKTALPAYRPSNFSDEMLTPDLPKQFQFSGTAPDLKRKTYEDETRNCFPLRSQATVSFKPEDGCFERLSIGFGGNPKKERVSDPDSLIRFSVLTNGTKKTLVEQPASTLLREWNDHSIEAAELPISDDRKFCVELEGKNSESKLFASYPVFIKKSKPHNIIVIILDGLNFNHLGIYNPKSHYSPNIDQFFDKKIKYTSAFTQEIWTRPAFASMFTSYYPSHHGIYDKTFFLEVPRTLPNMAEAMRENGYHTSAYVSHGWAAQLYGYSRGFDRFVWREAFEKPYFDAKLINYFTLETLENHKDKNQFIFLHYFDTHLPFFPHSPYRYYNNSLNDFRDVKKVYASAKSRGHFSEEDRRLIERDAVNKVREVDILLEPLFLKLQSRELRENTSVILTADHGFGSLKPNAFLDNGIYRLTPETAQVPLLVSPAENLNLRFKNSYDALVEGSIDLFPSVLDLAGATAETSPYAKSYLPDSGGELSGKEFALMESLYFDTYQLVMRNHREHYYLRCKKEYGGGKVSFDQFREEKLFNLTADSALTQDLLLNNSKLSGPFRELRKNLGIADHRSVPKAVYRTQRKQTVSL